MKILITGSKGFIGTALVKRLENLDDVYIEKDIQINILEKDKLFGLEKSDVIIHLAAKTSISNSFICPYDTYNTNILGTLNVLELAKQKKIQRIINVSTFVYGQPIYSPIDESHPINPHTPYNKSKVISEEICKAYSEDFGIDIVTLRPFYIYGPTSQKHSFIPSVLRQIKESGKVILSGENTRRDFLFVDDFINLVQKIIDNFPEGYNVYNVGYGKSFTLKEIVLLISKLLDTKVDITTSKTFRQNDITDMVADTTKASKSFNWKPRVTIEEGLVSVISEEKGT